MCCMWFAHDCALAIWEYMLETVHSAVRRLSKSQIAPFNVIISIIIINTQSPLLEKGLLREGSNPWCCFKQESEPNTLPTELFQPPKRNQRHKINKKHELTPKTATIATTTTRSLLLLLLLQIIIIVIMNIAGHSTSIVLYCEMTPTKYLHMGIKHAHNILPHKPTRNTQITAQTLTVQPHNAKGQFNYCFWQDWYRFDFFVNL